MKRASSVAVLVLLLVSLAAAQARSPLRPGLSLAAAAAVTLGVAR